MAGHETQETGEIVRRKRAKITRQYEDHQPLTLPIPPPCPGADGDGTTESGGDDTAFGEKLQEKGVLQDPLVVFGSNIMGTMILSKLDARSLAIARSVCRGWHVVASGDDIWAPKCEELWVGKAHLPRISKVEGLSKLAVMSLAIMDGKRTRITRKDLCDHAWEFHFTEEAPQYWRNMDPYWRGSGTLMRRYFHPDGSITADPEDKVWGGHESCYTTVTGILMAEGKIRKHYVRINRWPEMNVERKQDWGWVLSNRFHYYSSVPDADKKDGTGPNSFFGNFNDTRVLKNIN